MYIYIYIIIIIYLYYSPQLTGARPRFDQGYRGTRPIHVPRSRLFTCCSKCH